MINWFIDWNQRSLLQHVVRSTICIQKKEIKLVTKEMEAGQRKVRYCLSKTYSLGMQIAIFDYFLLALIAGLRLCRLEVRVKALQSTSQRITS